MEQNDGRLGASGSEAVDADAVRLGDSIDPARHRGALHSVDATLSRSMLACHYTVTL
jgi:hypothetical protein